MARLFFLIELVNERPIKLSVVALRNSRMVNPTKYGEASLIHFALQIKNAPVAKEVHKAPPSCALAYVSHPFRFPLLLFTVTLFHFIPFTRAALSEHPNVLKN